MFSDKFCLQSFSRINQSNYAPFGSRTVNCLLNLLIQQLHHMQYAVEILKVILATLQTCVIDVSHQFRELFEGVTEVKSDSLQQLVGIANRVCGSQNQRTRIKVWKQWLGFTRWGMLILGAMSTTENETQIGFKHK